MDTPRGHKRAEFNEKINPLTSAIETSFENNRLKLDETKLQRHLDNLAEKYQFDEELGKLRHKIYDAQALLFYLSGQDNRTLEFVEAAEEVNGGPTSISSQIRQELMTVPAYSETSNYTSVNTKKKRIEGWLAILVLALIIGIFINVAGSISEIHTNQALTADTISTYPGIKTLIGFEIAAQVVAVVTAPIIIYLILGRRRIAKYLGIVFYISIVVYNVIDLAAANVMFANNLNAINIINQNSSTAYEAIGVGILWAGYLISSKRVKATLTH